MKLVFAPDGEPFEIESELWKKATAFPFDDGPSDDCVVLPPKIFSNDKKGVEIELTEELIRTALSVQNFCFLTTPNYEKIYHIRKYLRADE